MDKVINFLILSLLIISVNIISAGDNEKKAINQYDVVFPIRDMRGHRESVSCIKVSHSDKYFISGSQDTNLILRVLKNSKIKKIIVGHKAPITGIAFSPDDDAIASVDANGILELWNFSGDNLKTLSTKNIVFYSVVFSNTGSLIAAGSSGNIIIWTYPDGKIYREIKTENYAINSLSFNFDDSHIIYATANGEINIVRIADSKKILNIKAHKDSIKAISYYQNNIASCSMDGYLKVWNFSDGKELFSTFAHQGGCKTVAFSIDGKYIATGGMDNYAKLWEINKKEPLKLFGGHIGPVNAVAFSKKYLITGGEDKTIKMWIYQ